MRVVPKHRFRGGIDAIAARRGLSRCRGRPGDKKSYVLLTIPQEFFVNSSCIDTWCGDGHEVEKLWEIFEIVEGSSSSERRHRRSFSLHDSC